MRDRERREREVHRRLLVDHGTGLPGRGVHLDDAVRLVAALVVLEGERSAVLAPHESGHAVGVGKERAVHRDLLARGHIEEHRALHVEHVARLAVQQGGVLGLELVFG